MQDNRASGTAAGAPFAAGDLAGAIGKSFVTKHFFGARLASQICLFVCRGRAYHVPAAQLRDLGQQQPDAAGGRVHDDPIAFPDRI